MSEDVRSQLNDLPEIGALPSAALDDLAAAGRVVTIPRGWTPVHQQEPADKAYLVLDGSISVVRDSLGVADIGVGSFAGEMGLVDHRLRNARLTAVAPVTVLAWPAADFQELRGRHPEFDALVRASTQARHEDNHTSS